MTWDSGEWKPWSEPGTMVADWNTSWGSSSGSEWSSPDGRVASSGDTQWQASRPRSRSGCRGSPPWHDAAGGQRSWGNSWNNRSWQGRSWQNKGQERSWQGNGEQKHDRQANAWQENISAEILEKLNTKMGHLSPGSAVAVVSLQGSLCPITLSHVMCCVEARNLLIDKCGVDGLETFSEIIGFIGCNSDVHVSGKLKRLYPPVDSIIAWEDRQMLVELATQEYDWLYAVVKPFDAFLELQSLHSNLHIKFFEVVGADNALSEKKWRRVNDTERLIIMGRAADPGQDNGTDAVCRAMRRDKQRREDLRDKQFDFASNTPLCIWGPELPAVSSTAARKALQAGDTDTLSTMLHPSVTDWNLREGPYAPTHRLLR